VETEAVNQVTPIQWSMPSDLSDRDTHSANSIMEKVSSPSVMTTSLSFLATCHSIAFARASLAVMALAEMT